MTFWTSKEMEAKNSFEQKTPLETLRGKNLAMFFKPHPLCLEEHLDKAVFSDIEQKVLNKIEILHSTCSV